MKKLILTLALAAAAAVCANAQIVVGAGYDGGTTKSTYTSGSTSLTESDNYAGFYVNAMYNYNIGNGLGVQAGIGANFYGRKDVNDAVVATYTIKYTSIELAIPVLVNYKYQINNDFAVGAFVGPEFGFDVMDNSKTTNDKNSDVITTNYMEDEDHQGFGLMAEEGLFVEYAQKYRLSFSAYQQLNNGTKASNVTEKNNGFCIGVSYIF